jgi:transposase
LPPYLPDLNPIEEFFAESKGYIKRNWSLYEEDPRQGFDTFLQRSIDIGAKKENAKGHFRNAGLWIEEYNLDRELSSCPV